MVNSDFVNLIEKLPGIGFTMVHTSTGVFAYSKLTKHLNFVLKIWLNMNIWWSDILYTAKSVPVPVSGCIPTYWSIVF
jgi:hypothetical protein